MLRCLSVDVWLFLLLCRSVDLLMCCRVELLTVAVLGCCCVDAEVFMLCCRLDLKLSMFSCDSSSPFEFVLLFHIFRQVDEKDISAIHPRSGV